MEPETGLLKITSQIFIPLTEIGFIAIRAQGPGGQNVNKVSSAIHLRFNIITSSLPDTLKQRLLTLNDQRLSKEGIIIIKAQRFRSQEKNKAHAIQRLQELLMATDFTPTKRRATKPTRGSQVRRVDSKVKHGKNKTMRKKVDP